MLKSHLRLYIFLTYGPIYFYIICGQHSFNFFVANVERKTYRFGVTWGCNLFIFYFWRVFFFMFLGKKWEHTAVFRFSRHNAFPTERKMKTFSDMSVLSRCGTVIHQQSTAAGSGSLTSLWRDLCSLPRKVLLSDITKCEVKRISDGLAEALEKYSSLPLSFVRINSLPRRHRCHLIETEINQG